MPVDKAVRNILENCMGIMNGEKLLIIADTKTQKLGFFFYENASVLSKDIGFTVDLEIIEPTATDGAEPPKEVADLMKMYDIELFLTSNSMTHTDARRNASRNGARIASMPGITKEMIKRTLMADYNKVAELTEKFAKNIDGKNKIHIRTKKGTDLMLSMKNRSFEQDNGIYVDEGSCGNLPAGEVCGAPVENSANGTLVIDGSMAPFGKVKEIKLKFKDGKVVSIVGDHSEELSKYLKTDNDRTIAELGIGTNMNAKLTGNVLEDEKILGTIHIAIGDNTSYPGGKNKSSIHFDGVVLEPTLLADGLCLIKHGKWL
ncbi:aminopeptidase [Candidatus Woesearchaeota archaeon]|nr:aminopeptidase [Candidatus Woesearchaeota archaeon]